MPFYPKAFHPERISILHASIRHSSLAVLRAAGINLILLQCLFLALFSYVFGSLSQQNTHVHNINIVFVDYDDDGLIGSAVREAYQQLEGPAFPSLVEQSPSQYPEPSTLFSTVCNIDYWGALYIAPNASTRLAAALTGSGVYNPDEVFTLIWNEARYPSTIDSALVNNLGVLLDMARISYSKLNGTQPILSMLNGTDPVAVATFANPWVLQSNNILPTTQGERLVFNTIMIILILLQEFFYVGIVNAILAKSQFYSRLASHHIVFFRLFISLIYTFIGSLCTAGAIWAFRYGWHVNANQFVLTWVVIWLFAHLNFLAFDVFTIWIPVQYVPMALVTWIVLNVTSILLPFELSPAFYKWAYAIPAHSVFQVLIDVWSSGCNPQLSYALPVLFAYEIVGLALTSIGVYRRAHYAGLAQEKVEKVIQSTGGEHPG
ncbi:nitrosoguanidine resistance protein SNG1 [Talaromyces proteolyticus]|uniref:Nitrosoguanidine resistance protein SNG1 n=1 Tax=Talaromyces proteolyticus TaxID=1131652 RepID=A0AAD4L110_9EURO|nr:nitrosoguanidine resistance protein SNG1 [Talaromyces proteolyticus]KAH8705588.1 nitrosoguanidine resistance protein SNG1 [Talaromyces proteolyticus]